jgi:hypothetical protein
MSTKQKRVRITQNCEQSDHGTLTVGDKKYFSEALAQHLVDIGNAVFIDDEIKQPNVPMKNCPTCLQVLDAGAHLQRAVSINHDLQAALRIAEQAAIDAGQEVVRLQGALTAAGVQTAVEAANDKREKPELETKPEPGPNETKDGAGAPAANSQVILHGSDLLPAHIEIAEGNTVQLGEVVQRAYQASGMTPEQWNALEGAARDDLLEMEVAVLKTEAATAGAGKDGDAKKLSSASHQGQASHKKTAKQSGGQAGK